MAIPVIETWTPNDTGGSAATSITLTKPSGVAAGDLLLLIVGSDRPNSVGWADVTGWTKFININSNASDANLACYWRIADETEGSTIEVGAGGNYQLYGWYIRISGVDQSTPINVIGTPDYTGATTHNPQPIDTTVDDCLAFYALAFDGGDGYTFSESNTGWAEVDELQSGTTGNDASGCWGTKDMPSAGSSGAVTITSTAADGSACIQFAIAPATVGDVTVTPTAVSAIASVVAPTVLFSSVTITPSALNAVASSIPPTFIYDDITWIPPPLNALASSVDPTVTEIWASINITPVAVNALASSVTPVVIVGSISITPATVNAVASSIDPTVDEGVGDVTVTPAAVNAIASVVDPIVQFGSVNVTPSALNAIASSVDPTVVAGSQSITPDALNALASVFDPTVIRGSINITPSALNAVAAVLAPTIIYSSINIIPAIVSAIASVVDPTVDEGAVDVDVTPAAVNAVFSAFAPTITTGAAVYILIRVMQAGGLTISLEDAIKDILGIEIGISEVP